MFNSLTGTVSNVGETELFLETDGGIEWVITISGNTAKEMPLPGNAVRVYTHLHHREDQMMLFGFATPEERTVFKDLLRVGGIGPRQAIRILSGMSVAQLVQNLDGEDIDALASVPGIGRKTAQKILLTLRGKLSLERDVASPGDDDIVEALVEMGFDRSRTRTAVASVRAEVAESLAAAGTDAGGGTDDPEGAIMRLAIVRLSAQEGR